MVKAASVVRGQFIGEMTSTGHVVQVPFYVAYTHSQACYAFDSAKTADCATAVPGNPSELVDTTTTAGLYNPLYYAVVGWPSLFIGDSTGVYAMRLLSGVFSSLFLALAFMMASTWRRPALPLLGLVIAATPMVFFLGASVNPNGVEATATLALFVGMVSVVIDRSEKFLVQRTAILTVAAIVAMNTRGLSMLWAVIAIAIPLTLLSWHDLLSLLRRRPVIVAMSAIALGAAAATAWLLGSNSLGTSTINAAPGFAYPGTGGNPWYGFSYVFEDTFKFSEGLVGIFGWLDTPAPLGVYFIWAVLSGALLLAAFVFLRGRRLVLAAALASCFVLFPPLIQAAFIGSGGLIWQGRYNLPLYLCLIFGIAGLLASLRTQISDEIISRISTVVLVLVAFGQVYAFATAIRRYTVGYTGPWKSILTAPEWSAPGGNVLWLLVFAGVITLAAYSFSRTLHSLTTAPTLPVATMNVTEARPPVGLR